MMVRRKSPPLHVLLPRELPEAEASRLLASPQAMEKAQSLLPHTPPPAAVAMAYHVLQVQAELASSDL